MTCLHINLHNSVNVRKFGRDGKGYNTALSCCIGL